MYYVVTWPNSLLYQHIFCLLVLLVCLFSLGLLDMQLLTNKNVLACHQSGAVLILGLSGLLAASHKDFLNKGYSFYFTKQTNKQKKSNTEVKV